MYQSNDLRKMAKRANERMRQLEKRDFNSPALKGVQAKLEMLGIRTDTARGRRFSETGKFQNKNEAAQVESVLRDFLEGRTSTIKGYKEYRRDILESAKEKYNYEEYGLSDEDYLSIWENLPDDEMDRFFGSEQIIAVVESYIKSKSGEEKEGALSIGEIVDKLQSAQSFGGALRSLGLTAGDVAKTLGTFGE